MADDLENRLKALETKVNALWAQRPDLSGLGDLVKLAQDGQTAAALAVRLWAQFLVNQIGAGGIHYDEVISLIRSAAVAHVEQPPADDTAVDALAERIVSEIDRVIESFS